MKSSLLVFLLVCLLVAPAVMSAQQGDLRREERWMDEIVDTIVEGDVIDLVSDGQEFIGLINESDQARGGVVIVHGRGVHPNWQDAIHPLRTVLPKKGWTTLSLQMPVLTGNAKYYDYVPLFDAAADRIGVGINMLRALGLNKIVLLAHSCGVHMAMHRIEETGSEDIDAFIGLGMGATDYNQFMAKPFPLQKMSIPVFDLYAEDDFPAVQKMAVERLSMIRIAGNAKSKQEVLKGADHYYTNADESLIRVVTSWLDSLGF